MTVTLVSILLAVLGGLAMYLIRLQRRHTALKGAWRALGVELEQIREKAEEFGRTNHGQVLWRLPTDAYDKQFDLLLSAGQLARDDLAVLKHYFEETKTVNRGLDAEMAATGDQIITEHNRNRLKVKRLAADNVNYITARAIIERFSRQDWWERLPRL